MSESITSVAEGATSPELRKIGRKAIVAASVGSALEWYDVFLYLYFALTISKLFFPTGNEWVSLLATVGAFGVSYLVKPIGALVMSSYADRVSRKAALTVTLSLMGIGVGLTAFAPTYRTIGIAGTAIIVMARFIQGFSSGGEYGAATAFLVERAPAHRYGFYSSFNIAAIGLTSVMGGLAGMLVNSLLSPQQVSDWGWRLPFIFGLTIIPVALHIRRTIPEPSKRSHARAPLTEAVSGHKVRLILLMGAFALVSVSNYALVYYLPTYAVRNLGLPPSSAFTATAVTGAVVALFSPLFGHVSDRWGRMRVMIFAAVALAVCPVPAYAIVVNHPTLAYLIVSQIILGILLTWYQAPMPALICDLFPPAIRTTGVAIVHDFTATFFGAFTPFMITLLIGLTGSKLIPGIYASCIAVLSLTCMFATRAMFGESWRPEESGAAKRVLGPAR